MRTLLMAVAIVASVSSANVAAVRDLLVEAAKAGGCPKPRVFMKSEGTGTITIEVDCPPIYYEEVPGL